MTAGDGHHPHHWELTRHQNGVLALCWYPKLKVR